MNYYIGLKYPRAIVPITYANFKHYEDLALRLEYPDSDIAEFEFYLKGIAQ
jgi:hypothetical protein